MATTTSTALGTSNIRSTARQQTRTNPARMSRTSHTNLRQNSLNSTVPQTVPAAPEPHGFYPAISHFTDAIAALPRDYRRHTSLLKEVDAKAWLLAENLHTLLSQCLLERETQPVVSTAQTIAGSSVGTVDDAIPFSSANSVNGLVPDVMSQYSAQGADPTLLQRRQMYAALRHNLMQMMVAMDEKNHVINNANEDLSKHIRRLDGVWPHIANEISEEARLGSVKHWAYTDTNPVVKKTAATSSRRDAATSLAILADNDIAHRSESRREAMLAKKQRLNQHLDSDFDDKAVRKVSSTNKVKKTVEANIEPPPAIVPGTAANKKKKPEKASGVGMERSFSGARTGGVAMSRENSQQDNTKKRKAPIVATTVARKRLNTNAGESPKLASSPLALADGKNAVKRSPALSTVRPVMARGRQNSNNSENLRRRPSSSATRVASGNVMTVSASEFNTVSAATGRTAAEIKNTMKEHIISKGEKLVEDDRPLNGEPPMRGGLLLERTSSKQSHLKREATEDKKVSSPRIPAAINVQEAKASRGRASKTSTPIIGTFNEAEAEESANGNTSENGNVVAKPKRAPRPRMKDHHGLHDSLSPRGLPMKRTHGRNLSLSSISAMQQSFSKPSSSRTRDRDRNMGNDEPTSRSTSRNNGNQHSQANTSTSASSISNSNANTHDIDGQLSDEDADETEVLHKSGHINDNDGNDSLADLDPGELSTVVAASTITRHRSDPTKLQGHKSTGSAHVLGAAADLDDEEAGDEEEEEEEDELRYCYCNGVSYGEMVACDNKTCAREWFHLDCIGLKSLPKSAKWYCDECKRKLKLF